MKHWISVGVVAATLAAVSTSFAADIARPVYKAPVVVPVFNWSGFYVGGHVGWGWQHDQATITSLNQVTPFTILGSSFNLERNGFLGGATVGVNWQPVGQPWVFGIEGDWSWASVDQSNALTFPAGVVLTGNGQTNWYATAAGRLGYAWDRSLFYVKGGAAWMDNEYFATATVAGVGTFVTNTFSNTRTGWMVGVGFEQAFYDNWSWKIEYNYMDFGNRSIALGTTALGTTYSAGVDVDTNVHVVKLGLNYRFGYAKTPVVAKY
jgi:outer membrane immunogenic protein